jgi:hypothetical protein
MSVINSMGVGKAKGSMGNVTYTTDKAGRTIGRQKPTTVANPQTEGQTYNRDRMRVAAKCFSAMLGILGDSWKRSKPNVAPYSEAVGKALKIPTWQNQEVGGFVASKIQTGSGNLQPLDNLTIVDRRFTVGTNIFTMDLNWTKTAFGNGQATDKIQVFLYNATDGRIEFASSDVARSDSSLSVASPTLDVTKYYVYFYVVKSANGLLKGDSTFLAYCFDETALTCQ